MREERIAEALAAHVERKDAAAFARETADLVEEERRELESLIHLADCLRSRMRPLQASSAFTHSLRQELVEAAERRIARRERRHRIAFIGAAVAGAVVSIASVVGGIVVLMKWLRTRTGARHASTA